MGNGQYTVGDVAKLAHVTVRTLHHYDEIGLLEPSGRTDAGYRLYSDADLERLQQILLYRELGFALDSIGEVLTRPVMDRADALRAQRELLRAKVRNTEAVIRAVDRTLESMEKGEKMRADELFEGFETFENAPELVKQQQAEHGAEAKERWGDTDAYTESMRRAKGYGKADWERMKAEGDALESEMASLMEAGESPDGEAAMGVAERMRAYIGEWFYECSHAMHANLADMYEADPRFRKHYDERSEGLASYVADAIRANAMRVWDGDD